MRVLGLSCVVWLAVSGCVSNGGSGDQLGEAGAAQSAPRSQGDTLGQPPGSESDPPNADDRPDEVKQLEVDCWSPVHEVGEQPDFSKPGCACEPGESACPMFCVDGNWSYSLVADCAFGASCLVDGLVYPTNHTRVPTPFSTCNTCSCQDGALVDCTTNECKDNVCPPPTQAGQRCAGCGPAGGCPIVETGCFENLCVNGVCGVLCY